MARISLYISDDLKARMDAAGDGVNWSDAARPALAAAVAAFEHSKGGTMHTSIERLRTSRIASAQTAAVYGSKEGRRWAEDEASYVLLRSLSRRRKDKPNEHPLAALQYAIDPEDFLDVDALHDRCHILAHSPSDEYAKAFVESAVGFFEQVREEVERDADDGQ
jgi:hypothetical protein